MSAEAPPTGGVEAAPTPAPARRSYAREITAAIGIPILVWSIGWAPEIVFATLLIAAVLVATAEFVMMAGRDHLVLRLVPPLAAEVLLLAMVGHGEGFLTAPLVGYWLSAMAILFPLVWMWGRGPLEGALSAVSVQLTAAIYVGVLGATILKTFLITDSGRKWVALILIATWAGDATAYYVGRKFGRHLFAPKVSPKKTWEGAIGGFAATTIVTVVLFHVFFGPWRMTFLVFFGMFLALFGQMGDLAESLFKRSAGIKDSGGLLPGHGGLLDRIDSLLWTGPIVLAVASWWESLAPPL